MSVHARILTAGTISISKQATVIAPVSHWSRSASISLLSKCTFQMLTLLLCSDTFHSELELPLGSDPALNADRDQHEDANHDSFHFARIGRKILDISAQAREGQLSHLTPILLDLEAGLDQAEAPLPKKIQVAPNQHTWPETAAVMVARPKTKHRTQTDPYGGGERNGKKAKSDTQVARTVLSRYAHHPSL